MRGKRITILCLGILIGLINHSTAQDIKEVTCTGKVTDVRGKPVNGAKVQLFRITVISGEVEIELAKELITKDDGAFTIKAEAGESELLNYAFILVKNEGLAMGWANWRLHDDFYVEIKLDRANVLAGVVVDEDGKPVADAQVGIVFMMIRDGQQPQYVIGDMSLKILMVKSDTQGKFSFSGIPEEASVEFLVKKPGRATVNTFSPENIQGESLQFSSGQTDIKLVQPVEAKIEGVVVAKESGKPVAGIKLMTARDRNRPDFVRESVVSKEDGSFVIDGLVAGRHFLQLVQQTEGTAEWIAEPVEVNTETGETKSGVKIELIKGGVLEVAVTGAADQQPVEKAIVHILPQGSNTAISVLTNGDGIARIRLLPGEYRVVGVSKRLFSSNSQPEMVTVETGEIKRVEFQLTEPPKIAGVVRDENGEPLVGVRLSICPFGRETVSTDAEGRFDIDWEPQSIGSEEIVYCILARHVQRNLAAVVEINEDMKTLDIKLEPGVILTGKVVDSNDKSIEGAQVNVSLRVSNFGMILEQEQVRTDAEGTFEIKAIAAEQKYGIKAQAKGYGRQNVEIHTGDAVDGRLDAGVLKLALANLSVSGIVVDVNDEPLADVRIYCYGEGQPNRNTITDSDGKFTLHSVCAGRIQISADTGSRLRLYGNVQTEGGATDVKIVVGKMESSNRYVPKRPPSLIGKPLPELKDFDVELSPADTNDTMVLVCFWDMEQRPSRRCIMELNKQAEELKQKGVTIVAVHASMIGADTLNDWLKKNNISIPVGMIRDVEEKTRLAWGVKSLPWLILTDSKHIVRAEGFALSELDGKIKANN